MLKIATRIYLKKYIIVLVRVSYNFCRWLTKKYGKWSVYSQSRRNYQVLVNSCFNRYLSLSQHSYRSIEVVQWNKSEVVVQVDLAGLLTDNPNVTVSVANRVYVKTGAIIKREFMDSLQAGSSFNMILKKLKKWKPLNVMTNNGIIWIMG